MGLPRQGPRIFAARPILRNPEPRPAVGRRCRSPKQSPEVGHVEKAEESSTAQNGMKAPGRRREEKVFLVHGHDNSAIPEIARFLERARLEVVVLREQPNAGATVIEKLCACSDVGFAVVLMTAD